MAIFKWEKCPECKKKLRAENPTTPGKCPVCGAAMAYSENWHISFYARGREVIQSASPKRKEAEAALAKQRTDIREGKFFSKKKDFTWEEAVKKFRVWFTANTADNTRLMYENCIKMLTPHFREYTLRQITPELVEEYKTIRSKSVTNSTINRDIATIKRMYALMCDEWKLIDYNPVRSVKKLKENASRIRFLSEDEKKRLLDACIYTGEQKKKEDRDRGSNSKWLRLGVSIALNTGIRKEAITSLMVSEIDFPARFIRAKTKGGKITNAPMNDQIYAELWDYCEEKKKEKIASPYLFPSRESSLKPIRADIHRAFERACEIAGIEDFRFHDLRHTFARDFYKRTKDWKALSQILNHGDVSVTMKIYVNFDEDDLTEAMKKFNAGS